MPKIVKVPNSWSESNVNELVNALRVKGIDGVVVRDSEMQVFEYEDLEEVTIHAEEAKEQMETDEKTFEETLCVV